MRSNLFDTGFQLSFAAVAAIVTLYGPIEKRLSFCPQVAGIGFRGVHGRVDRDYAFAIMAFWHHHAGRFDSQYFYCPFIGFNSGFRIAFGAGRIVDAAISVGLGRMFESGF